MIFFSEVTFDGSLWGWLLIPVISLALWWLVKQADVPRIRSYGSARGWRFEEISEESTSPIGAGDDEDRHYSVRYVDAQGVVHTAKCKTSLFNGVYFTDVRSHGRAKPLVARFLPIDCPRCGARVGEAAAECPHCLTPREATAHKSA
jgi:hypothetical protein